MADPEVVLTEAERKKLFDMAMELHELQRRANEWLPASPCSILDSPNSQRKRPASRTCRPTLCPGRHASEGRRRARAEAGDATVGRGG